MSAFARFRSADPMGLKSYIVPGNHIFLVTKTSMGPSKNPQTASLEKTIVNFKIIKSDTMKVGDPTDLVEMSNGQGYLGNVNAFTCGILGYSIEEVKPDPKRSKEDEAAIEAMYDAVWGVPQICVGMLVKCTALFNSAKTYTNKVWEPVPASEYAEYGLIAPEGAFAG